jgi:magnesium-dependent phosphatase 1
MSYPKLFAFDLDGCLWSPEMFELWDSGGAPFTAHNDGKFLTDKKGTRIELLGASRRILEEITSSDRFRSGNVKIAYVSESDEPAWAMECLRKFTISEGQASLDSFGAVIEIYKARKDKSDHLKAVHAKTGIAFRDMLFFDNEPSNIEDVARLGVVGVPCPDGLTLNVFRSGLKEFGSQAVSQHG